MKRCRWCRKALKWRETIICKDCLDAYEVEHGLKKTVSTDGVAK